MSDTQIQAFLLRVLNDASLYKKLTAPGADHVAIAKEAGFSLTASDFEAAGAKMSAAELELVSGAGTCISILGYCGNSNH